MKILFIRTLILLIVLLSMTSYGILIDFDEYTVGQSLTGQPATGTKWVNAGSFVVTNELSAHGNCVQMKEDAAQYSTGFFTPTDSDFGGVHDTNNVYLYSFDVRFLNNSGSSTLKFIDVWVGRNFVDPGYIARLGLYGNGNFGVYPSPTYSGVLSDGEWHTISCEFSYLTHTYSMAIDGDVKFTDKAFASGSQNSFGYFGLNVTTAIPEEIECRVDNIYLDIQPSQGSIFFIK